VATPNNQLPDDTRQAQQLEAVEGHTRWLDDDETEDDEDAYHTDPLSLLERKEREAGVNIFGHPIN
jgi:hypothetical protein